MWLRSLSTAQHVFLSVNPLDERQLIISKEWFFTVPSIVKEFRLPMKTLAFHPSVWPFNFLEPNLNAGPRLQHDRQKVICFNDAEET